MADTDILYTAEILKAALPYVDVRTKTTMDLLVKLYELQYCFRRLRTNSLVSCDYEEQKVDMESMLKSIRPICKDPEKAMVDQFLNFFNAKRMYEMYNSYMSAMKTMQEFGGFSSGADGEASDNFMNNFSGFDFSSIFGNNSGSTSDSEKASDSAAASEYHDNEDFSNQRDREGQRTDDTEGGQNNGGNNQMYDMLKNMIPPEQMSTFDNLRMLFNTMSYDDSKKTDSI